LDKFGRNYVLGVATTTDGPVDLFIKPPFTLEFDITRNTLTSANVCQVRVYNLSEANRNKIRHNVSDYGSYKALILKAGYGDNLPKVFSGNISQAWSVREGTNMITQMECFDGGFAFANGTCNKQYPAGTPIRSIIIDIASTCLPNVKLGTVGEYPGTITRSNSYSGNTMKILGELTGFGAFIDGETFYALGTDEYVAKRNGVALIDSNSGLLGTPVLEQSIIHFDMLFEPGLNLGQRILLDSITEQGFNGNYIVNGVKHRGMISEAVCGSAITTVTMNNIKEPTAV